MRRLCPKSIATFYTREEQKFTPLIEEQERNKRNKEPPTRFANVVTALDGDTRVGIEDESGYMPVFAGNRKRRAS
jgi:hypothetical protein